APFGPIGPIPARCRKASASCHSPNDRRPERSPVRPRRPHPATSAPGGPPSPAAVSCRIEPGSSPLERRGPERRGQTEFQVNLKLGLTSRQESSGKEDSLKPFRWNPAGNQSRPVEPDQQPEASLAWWVGDHPCEA